MIKVLAFSVCCLLLFQSCREAELKSEVQVYFNDFENSELENLEKGSISSFNGSQVLGFYNKGEVILTLQNLPKHDFVEISFTLNIHGSWDGNLVGEPQQPVGPDYWGISVDDWVLGGDPFTQERTFMTTFSNSPCNVNFCLRQSFPSTFPSFFNAKAGASLVNLPASCVTPTGGLTSQYQIKKVFRHRGRLMKIRFFDELKQGNVEDEFCDENWSLDNLSVKVISTM